MENSIEMFVARYDHVKFEASIIPIDVIKETDEFVIFKHDIKKQDRMKKVTDFHQVFSFYDQAKKYLIERMADDMDYLNMMQQELEVKIEVLKQKKSVDHDINIEFTGIKLSEINFNEEVEVELMEYEPVEENPFKMFYDKDLQFHL